MTSLRWFFRLVLPSFLLISAPPARADEALSLRDALARAVTGNLDLQRERVQIQLADANVMSALGAFDLFSSGNVGYSRRETPRLRDQTDFVGGATETLSGSLGVRRLLETGGSLGLNWQQSRVETNSGLQAGTLAGRETEQTTNVTNVTLNFTHPLLRGFGTEVNLANLRQRRIEKDLALLNRQTRAANVLRDVVLAYWELAYATQDLAIQRSAVELAREQLRVTQAQIEVGRAAPVDAAAPQRAIAERLQAVVLSEQNLYFRSLELRRLLGLPEDAGQPLFSARDLPQASARQVDAGAELRRALETNPQLKAARMGLRLTDLDLAVAAASLRPRLDFNGQLGTQGRQRQFDQSVSQAVNLEALSWSANLEFDLPVQNRAARGALRAAQLSVERAKLDARDLELLIRDTVLRLASEIQTASRRGELARETVGYAQQNLEAERARFSVGRSTNNDVLLRQQELKNAEREVVRATVDLLESEAELAALTTDLFDRYGVQLKGL